MRIAVLYIGTGRYSVFWKDFFLSSEKYFMENAEKHYFVFTDNENLDYENNANVTRIYQKKLGWPYDTLMRFEMFLTQEEKLCEYDYIFFFNANMKFVEPVGEEILPSIENDGLVMGLHPGYYKKDINDVPFERNPDSKAYIPLGEGKHYVQGCLNGGTSEAYLKLCHTCNDNTKNDLERNVIAKVHDESHLNKYVSDKNPLILPCNYLYPIGSYYKEYFQNIKIVQRDKFAQKYGGADWLRGETDKQSPSSNWYTDYIGYKIMTLIPMPEIQRKFNCKLLKYNEKYE